MYYVINQQLCFVCYRVAGHAEEFFDLDQKPFADLSE